MIVQFQLTDVLQHFVLLKLLFLLHYILGTRAILMLKYNKEQLNILN